MKSLFESQKKGQLNLADAPYVIIAVGFIFLLMATIAYVSSEYRVGIGSKESGTATNQSQYTGSIVYVNSTGYEVPEYSASDTSCNFANLEVTKIYNATNATGDGGYYSTSIAVSKASVSGGTITNASSDEYNNVSISYTYDFGGTACDVTKNLESELDDNTSIAGVVLTISLIGIVLTILIGVFASSRMRRL